MNLKKLRLEQNLTQEEFGKIIGQTKSNISKYENGLLEPNINTLKLIAEHFNVSTDYILGKSDIRDPYKDKSKLPEGFNTPEEAISFILEQDIIMGFGGFNLHGLTDEEKVQFAHEILEQLKLVSYKYKK